jgi:zinc/manganese transport system substrate-binding protein
VYLIHIKSAVNVGLKSYNDTINTIKQKYHGTPVGSTESIFVYMADALKLNLTTPPGFMSAIAESQEPTATDKATFDKQVTSKKIKVLLYNKQTVTPDTTVLEKKAKAATIPTVSLTETLAPATDTFQVWQTRQLKDLEQALAKNTGH